MEGDSEVAYEDSTSSADIYASIPVTYVCSGHYRSRLSNEIVQGRPNTVRGDSAAPFPLHGAPLQEAQCAEGCNQARYGSRPKAPHRGLEASDGCVSRSRALRLHPALSYESE